MNRFQPADLIVLESFIEQEPTLVTIHHNFLDEYGDNLKEMQPRFAQRHDPQQTVSVAEFEYLLGIDVAHDMHAVAQWDIARRMVQRGNPYELTHQQKRHLLFAEVVHDYGEASQMLDIAFGDKKPEDEATEQEHWVEVIEKVVPDTYKNEVLEDIQPIIFDEFDTLHGLFDVSEKIGYMQTGLRAGRIAFLSPNVIDQPTRDVMLSIATDVRRRQDTFYVTRQAQHPQLARTVAANDILLWDLLAAVQV
jgi:hypothetical protein